MSLTSFAKGTLYVEAALNIFLFGPLSLIYPEFIVKTFLPNVEISSVASHHMRYFGVAIISMVGILLWRALDEGGKTMKFVLESLIIADVLYVGSFCLMVQEFNSYNEAVIGNIIFGVFLFLCRFVLLTQYDFKVKTT